MHLEVQTYGVSSLFVLIEQDNVEGAKTLLGEGNLNAKNDLGQTPLHFAIECGHVEIALYILSHNPIINTRDNDNWSPLISSAKLGNLELTKTLLDHKSNQYEDDENEIVDMAGWSAVTWASYRGHADLLTYLLDNTYQTGDPSCVGDYGMAPLLWAAGRGNAGCVEVLIRYGADIQKSDKFGSTALFWACRKGHIECVQILLRADVDVNAVGANGQNSMIVAAKNGHIDCVDELLRFNSNVNQTDKDGNSALGFSCASGKLLTVEKLLASGAYLNHPNHKQDTPLILATRYGHVKIVRLLLTRNCNVNHSGSGNRTALYWACDNSKAEIVKELLKHDCDTEIQTFEGETCLLRAVKNRYAPIVDSLLQKGAKVSAKDNRGDSPLHVSLRSKNKTITEMLLRNPRDSRLLYKMNYEGQTPYQIDLSNRKSILTQIFGRKSFTDPLHKSSDFSQYDLYASALADILSEPTLTPPITVGVYAQWGSGKSFLLKKLADTMNSFVGETGYQIFYVSAFWFVPLLLILWIGILMGVSFLEQKRRIVSISLLVLVGGFYFAFILTVRFGQTRWDFIKPLAHRMSSFEDYINLIFRLIFNQGYIHDLSNKNKPVRFMFTDYSRLSSVGGETSLAEMVGALSKTTERNFGILPTRIYRAMKPRNDSVSSRRICCLPFSVVAVLFVVNIFTLSIIGAHDFSKNPDVSFSDSRFTLAYWILGGLAVYKFLLIIITIWPLFYHIAISPYRRVLAAAAKVNTTKGNATYESFMMILKKEVEHLSGMVNAFDCVGNHQTRLVVEVNGLDSCEQDRVLDVLETVNVLFTQSPYIVILAIDDNIIVKAVDRNLNKRAQLEINGRDYLRNMIHLPFYMQDQSVEILKRQKQLSLIQSEDTMGRFSQVFTPFEKITEGEVTSTNLAGSSNSLFGNNMTASSIIYSHDDSYRELRRRSARTSRHGGSNAFDLTKMLATEDWFSSISPQIMKRILNVVSLTGRLLRANRLPFTWDCLATWINMTEVWPYRTSWIVLYIEETDDVDPKLPLKAIYQKILHLIPISTQQEPLLEIDNADSRQLEVFLSAREPQLTVQDIIRFLPSTVNLDPKLREWILDWQATRKTGDNQPVYTQKPFETDLSNVSTPLTKAGMQTNGLLLSIDSPDKICQAQNTFSPMKTSKTAPNAIRLIQATAKQLSRWVYTIEGLTESGKENVSQFMFDQNVSGYVVNQLNGDYSCIRNGAEMNLGDGLLFSQALNQSLHQPVIPAEIENLSLKVPLRHSVPNVSMADKVAESRK